MIYSFIKLIETHVKSKIIGIAKFPKGWFRNTEVIIGIAAQYPISAPCGPYLCIFDFWMTYNIYLISILVCTPALHLRWQNLYVSTYRSIDYLWNWKCFDENRPNFIFDCLKYPPTEIDDPGITPAKPKKEKSWLYNLYRLFKGIWVYLFMYTNIFSSCLKAQIISRLSKILKVKKFFNKFLSLICY